MQNTFPLSPSPLVLTGVFVQPGANTQLWYRDFYFLRNTFHFPGQLTFSHIVVAARSLQITGTTALYSFANASLTTKPSRAGRHWRLAAFTPTKQGNTVLEALHSNLLTVSPVGGMGCCVPVSHSYISHLSHCFTHSPYSALPLILHIPSSLAMPFASQMRLSFRERERKEIK